MKEIVRVGARELEKILPLIGDYQRFYGFQPNEARNRDFFSRFANGEDPTGEQYVYLENGEPLAFATIYGLPSSLTGKAYCVLNDLYTVPPSRGQGIARELIRFCGERAKEKGFSSIEWQTQAENKTAQRLYDSLGALRSSWLTYSLPL